jgi:SOS response regulatory protein OraA/RecX
VAIDVHAAARDHTVADLEMLGQRHGRGEFRLDDLRDRLGTAQWIDDAEFEAYDLPRTRSQSCGNGPRNGSATLSSD